MFYDSTCESSSLLLKVIDEADSRSSIYGQKKDVATAALARKSMILHSFERLEIHRGQSTLSVPFFKNKDCYTRTFDYVIANVAEPEVVYNEEAVLNKFLKLLIIQRTLNKKEKEALVDLDKKVIERYKTLSVEDIKQLVVDDK